MKDEKKNMPKVRFSGFSDAWELRKLGGILKVNSGRDYKHLNDGNIPVYGTGGYMLSVDAKLSDHDAIGIGRKGTIDKPQYLKAPFWTVDTLFYLTPLKDNELKFIHQVAYKINWKKYAEQTGVPSLSKVSIEKIETFVPNKEEQHKIGAFFKQIDDTIALHQRKLEALKEMKKGFLQQLFPQKGEKVPRVRFADFHDEWELRKVLEMSKESFGGGTPKTGNEEYWQGNFPWIQSSDIIKEQLYNVKPTKFITEEAIKNSATKVIPGNSIAIVTRVGVGKLALISFAFATSQDFISLSKLNVDNYFGVYSLYQMLQKQLNNIQGTSIKGITKKELLEKKLQIPLQIDEQQNIGTFFKQADNTIILQQNKLEQLKILKKAYLQNMFI